MSSTLAGKYSTLLKTTDNYISMDIEKLVSLTVEQYTHRDLTIVAGATETIDISSFATVNAIIISGDEPFDISLTDDTGDVFFGVESTNFIYTPEQLPDHLKVKAGTNDVDLRVLVTGT